MNAESTTEVQNTAKRRLKGVVVRKSGDKTVMVEVVRTMSHPSYGKTIKTTKRYMAHDPENSAAVGDDVVIVESRPLSRKKRWALV